MGRDTFAGQVFNSNPVTGTIYNAVDPLLSRPQLDDAGAPPAQPDMDEADPANVLKQSQAAGRGRASTISSLTGYQGLGASGSAPTRASRSLMGV